MLEHSKEYEYVLDINYDITLNCNNRCPYCYAQDILDNSTFVNEEVFQELIKQVNDFVEKNPKYQLTITVLGGEPYLVSDKLVELIESVPSEVKFNIHSNCNYDYTLLAKTLRFPSVDVNASWHLSSDLDRVRENVLRYRSEGGKIEVGYLLDDDTADVIYEHAMWSYENKVNFSFDVIRSADKNRDMFTGFTTQKYQEMLLMSRKIREMNGGRKVLYDYTFGGLREDEQKEISSVYFTFCKMNHYKVDYDGKLHSVCGYIYESHIKNGLGTKEVFCNKKRCYCSIEAYKKLYGIRH